MPSCWPSCRDPQQPKPQPICCSLRLAHILVNGADQQRNLFVGFGHQGVDQQSLLPASREPPSPRASFPLWSSTPSLEGVQHCLGEDAVTTQCQSTLSLQASAACWGRHRLARCTHGRYPGLFGHQQYLPMSASPTLLGLKSNFDKTATTTSTTRPPLHAAFCSLPMLTGPGDEVGPPP